jgi:hypothetical protein
MYCSNLQVERGVKSIIGIKLWYSLKSYKGQTGAMNCWKGKTAYKIGIERACTLTDTLKRGTIVETGLKPIGVYLTSLICLSWSRESLRKRGKELK